MANKWHCDRCGKETFISPRMEPVMVPATDDKGQPLVDADNKPILKQATVKTSRQHPVTGEITQVQVPAFKDLQERVYIVRVVVNDESVQRDLCRTCLDKLMPQLKAAREALVGLGSK